MQPFLRPFVKQNGKPNSHGGPWDTQTPHKDHSKKELHKITNWVLTPNPISGVSLSVTRNTSQMKSNCKKHNFFQQLQEAECERTKYSIK
jgi:hypothetical protein